jgi:glycerate 2-kinase
MTPVTRAPIEDLHRDAQDIFEHALGECGIPAAFDRHLRFQGKTLIRNISPLLPPSVIELNKFKNIVIIAIGKAALPLMETLLARMSRRKGVRGMCCAPQIPKKRNWRIRYFAGGHPLPNKSSFDAARAALHMLHRTHKDTFVFFLVSGGGSAMFELPLDRNVSLEDTMAFHEALVASGATIAEINTVRKHFSAVKGGRLAMAAPEATKFSLLLPDVPLRHMDALASSPTLPDRTTVAQAREILGRYHLMEKFPQSVRFFFQQEELPETPGVKATNVWNSNPTADAGSTQAAAYPAANHADPFGSGSIGFDTLLSSHDLVNAARDYAKSLGYKVVIDDTCDEWDYADAAHHLLERFHALRQEHPRLCLISGGEVTVTLSGPVGAGGRNQQFALACGLDLAKSEGEALAVFSAGTDGIDGNTNAAGAIADTTTVSRARSYGFDPQASLAEFNACPLFTALGDAVMTGPTGQNLRDLRLLLADQSVASKH